MKFIFFFILLIACGNTYCQKNDDTKIIVTLDDPSNIYYKTRQAILYSNFIIRDDSNKDTLVTKVERLENSTVHMMVKAVIRNNTVELSGAYGLYNVDFWGFPSWPKGFQRVIYYKESDTWRILRSIAIKIDGKMSFVKEN